MALTKDPLIKNYPQPAYNYRVDIGPDTVYFSEISGLEMGIDAMPDSRKPSAITLKKGYVKERSVKVLHDWITSIQLNRVDKKDLTVYLLDEKGEPVVSWKVSDAFPTKLTAPSFSSTSNEVAIESMELMANGIEMTEL